MPKALTSSRDAIRCGELSNLSEIEIRDELKSHRVIEVHRVTQKKEGEVIPTNTSFLTFNTPDIPREVKVGYLKVRVDRPQPAEMFKLQLVWRPKPALQNNSKMSTV